MAAAQALNQVRTDDLAEKQIAEAMAREAAESQRQMRAGRKGEGENVMKLTKKGMVKMTKEEADELDRDYERNGAVGNAREV